MDKQYEEGTPRLDAKYKIDIMDGGPYLVYGRPPMQQAFITPNSEGASWTYRLSKKDYQTQNEPVALCRCGASKNKPYCDGAHTQADWDPALTAPRRPLLDDAEAIEGPEITLTDNQKYCAFARFCDAYGRVWNLTEIDDPKAKEIAIYEANHCPAGRLKMWDKKTDKPYELETQPAVDLVEDPALRISAGLFVRGGIPVTDQKTGYTYEVRNRVALCRCGQSSNKPFCDGTHASMKFKDGLPTDDQDGGEF